MDGQWTDAQRAWKRLRAWHGTDAEDAEAGPAALDALGDITTARRLLDQAEVGAVRRARRAGEPWSDIAARLGTSRQAAWERWRDLDPDRPGSSKAGGTDSTAPDALPPTDAATSTRKAQRGRRRLVEVPDVRGLTVPEALGILTGAGLDAESATADIPLLAPADELRTATVVRQYPDSGTRVRGATVVRLWLERGDGSAGVREPRRPAPPPIAARALPDDELQDAAG